MNRFVKVFFELHLAPAEVLSWRPPRLDIELLGLLAYFFSLRPQELVSLEQQDFVWGFESHRMKLPE